MDVKEQIRILMGQSMLRKWSMRLEWCVNAREMLEAWQESGPDSDDPGEVKRLRAHVGLTEVLQNLETMTTDALQNVQRLQEFAEVKKPKKPKK